MKQVMNYNKDNGLLNMIRRTDPMIVHTFLLLNIRQLFMKHLLFIIIVLCGIAITSSCKRESFTEYRLEEVDSIHISHYKNRLKDYVCIRNPKDINHVCDILYNSTTICPTHFYPNMEISLYSGNKKQVFGVSGKYIKGNIGGESRYNLEEILKNIYENYREKNHRDRFLIPRTIY